MIILADSPVSIYFGIDYKSRRSRQGEDPSKRIGKAELPSLETELLAAEESLNDISREIEFARKQEILLTQATGTGMSRECCKKPQNGFKLFAKIFLSFVGTYLDFY